MEINLKNKTAWVFGGSQGIGRSIAIALSQAGANILLSNDEKKVKEITEILANTILKENKIEKNK